MREGGTIQLRVWERRATPGAMEAELPKTARAPYQERATDGGQATNGVWTGTDKHYSEIGSDAPTLSSATQSAVRTVPEAASLFEGNRPAPRRE